MRRGRELEKGKDNRANKQGWAKGAGEGLEDTEKRPSMHTHMLTHRNACRKTRAHTHTHTYVCDREQVSAGESEAISCGKKLSGDIKQKDKRERRYMTTP